MTVDMGGRVPIFYAAVVTFLAFKERAKIGGIDSNRMQYRKRLQSTQQKWLVRVVSFLVSAALLNYFVAVFNVRSDTVGGSMGMFDMAERIWGVGFSGPIADLLFAMFGKTLLTLSLFLFGI